MQMNRECAHLELVYGSFFHRFKFIATAIKHNSTTDDVPFYVFNDTILSPFFGPFQSIIND